MSRTTDSKKTRLVKLRLTDDLYEELISTNDGNLSETIRNLLQVGLENKDQVRLISDYTVSERDSIELKSMADCFGMTYDGMLHEVKNLLESGEIKCANGMLYTDVCPFDYRRFVEICQEKRIPPQEAMNKMCQMLARE